MLNLDVSFYKKSPKAFIGILVVTAFIFGIIFANNFSFFSLKDEKCLSNLKFINPEPGCELFEDKTERMSTLQGNLETQIDGYLQSKRVTRISVFARDLQTRRFVGVNDGEVFYMASLIKLPLTIAYFRLSEITPDLFSQQLKFTASSNQYSIQDISSAKALILGKSYQVKDLIYSTLAYSDNSAAEMLAHNFVSDDYLQKIMLSLGLQPRRSDQPQEEYLTTAKVYAGVFRILYNSSFLQRNSSNEILKVLTESTFNDGATALLPKGLVISHKFGERTAVNSNNEVVFRQLHDCGIVYAKNGEEPYSFCIMTEGKDFTDLKAVIQNISLTIYKGIQE